MATFKATIGNCNGYTSHDVEISGVTTQAAAKRAIEATHPGASIRGVRFISSKDWYVLPHYVHIIRSDDLLRRLIFKSIPLRFT